MKVSGKMVGGALMVVAYVVSALLVFNRSTAEARSDRVTIRFSQWQLEGTVRKAFDAVIARYEQLNPKVHVVQLAIPDTVYLPWVQTQMVGGTGPDIAEYVWIWPDIARRFQPLDDDIAKPNPYNKGTPLEGVAWRETNIDGMSNDDSFIKSLSHYYGITVTSHVSRIVYNRALLREITGSDRPPRTYREFIALCTRIREYARTHGRNLSPLGCSQDTAPFFSYCIMGAMGVKLAEQLDYRHRLQIYQLQLASQYLRGEWSFETAALEAGLRQLGEIGGFMTPGFVQRKRHTAITDFVAQRTVMIVAPSWDASSLPLIASFEIGAFNFPYPREDDPVYGPFVKSPFGEGPRLSVMGLYLNRLTPHRAEAIDFLQFLTSVEGSGIFTRISNWQPATVGVKAEGLAAQFTQATEGYTWGATYFGITIDADKFIQSQYYTLWNPNGGVRAFQDQMKAGLAVRIRDDLRRESASAVHNVQREDCLAAAAYFEAKPGRRPEKLPLVTISNEVRIYQFGQILALPDRSIP
ncbi:MAG: transporter substrate-binding protein [Verrucomicrobia bacterium]|nr:transporter substrate-binding protein [Verrucomicrobiota bacterium]